jgi:hypothetical protein
MTGRAANNGIDADQIEAARDADDPVKELATLIATLERETALVNTVTLSSKWRAELEALSVRELRGRSIVVCLYCAYP